MCSSSNTLKLQYKIQHHGLSHGEDEWDRNDVDGLNLVTMTMMRMRMMIQMMMMQKRMKKKANIGEEKQ